MKNQDQYPNADRQIMLRDTAQQHLPSTEVRELIRPHKTWAIRSNMVSVQRRRRSADFMHQGLLSQTHDSFLCISIGE